MAGPGAAACPVCGDRPRWESVLEGEEERWLSVCRCGRLRAFLPGQPALEPEDPLRAFLLGPGRPLFPPAPLARGEWAPPCPAVQRLRECLHRPYMQLRVDSWRVRAWDERRESP